MTTTKCADYNFNYSIFIVTNSLINSRQHNNTSFSTSPAVFQNIESNRCGIKMQVNHCYRESQ